MIKKSIICLANSKKPPSGRCIAGKNIVNGVPSEWIRPVSNRPSHEVSEDERAYENGKKAQVLDIIRIGLLKPTPLGHQTENYLFDDNQYWVKEGRADWKLVLSSTDKYDANFWCKADSTYHGKNDKVSEEASKNVKTSLKLIRLKDVSIRVKSEGGYEGAPPRRRVRLEFIYNGHSYILSLTDPEVEESYLGKPDGSYKLSDVAVCVSMVEVFHGYAFRVVAGLFWEGRCQAKV